MNLYDILGLRKDASEAEIRKAAKKAQQKAHPDRPGGDEAKFKEIGRALAVLSDPERREQYDKTGEDKPGEDAPLTDEQQAVSVLGKMFCFIAEKEEGDIIEACRREIGKGLIEGPKVIANHKRKIAKLNKILTKHLKFAPTDRPDILGNALRGQLGAHNKQLATMEQSLRIGPIMLQLLEGYNWIHDTPQYMYNDMFIFGSSILDSKGP